MPFRTLRTYRRFAQIQHHCDRCQGVIEPGDEYEAEVEVRWKEGQRRRIIVWKEHINPDCDFPEFPDDDYEEDEEEVDLEKAA